MSPTQSHNHVKINLPVTTRNILGKQVRRLRKEGTIPANVFGDGMKATSILVNAKEFAPIYKQVKETGIVYLNLEKDAIPTLIKDIQRHPVSNDILHIDFRKVNLKQKIETIVPIMIVGESTAIAQLSGILLTQADHLNVECLPENIPANIEIDISSITELGQEIKVSDIPAHADYVLKEEPERVILSVIAHKEESVVPETTVTTVPEVIGEAPATEESAEQTEEHSA
ncbi:50S ribosomal protein L25 [Candidatus Roizmanbacteria bacterium]|nr:50S ribosomal protein L25 [Candidatus Roizmanbacteria bacterium]